MNFIKRYKLRKRVRSDMRLYFGDDRQVDKISTRLYGKNLSKLSGNELVDFLNRIHTTVHMPEGEIVYVENAAGI